MNYNFNYVQNPALWPEMVNAPPYSEVYSSMYITCPRCGGWHWPQNSGRGYSWQCRPIRVFHHPTYWIMKRPRYESDEDESTPHNASKKSFWAAGLLSAMKDPKCVLKEDDKIVIISDKYPKAEYHFLVLPKEDISNISKLNQEHLPLLQHMEDVGRELSNKHADHTFLFGYHALASMMRLHLHVISDDFNSSALKSKKHWNSFTTPFFISSQELIKSIEKNGKIEQISQSHAKELMDTPLKCHKCSMRPSNMPKLKQHLLVHRLQERHATEKK